MTRLAFEDMAIDRAIEPSTIRDGLAHAFSVKAEAVVVVDTLPASPLPKACKVLCERRAIGGDFPVLLALSLRNQTLAPAQVEGFLRKLCAQWRCRILVPDPSPDPYAMLLFSADSQESVSVDTTALDERGVYSIDAGHAVPALRLTSTDERWHLSVQEGERILVGRADDVDIPIDDRSVAKHQAYLSVKAGVLRVEDAGGPSGTFVNETLIRQTTVVHANDRVRLGGITFVLSREATDPS